MSAVPTVLRDNTDLKAVVAAYAPSIAPLVRAAVNRGAEYPFPHWIAAELDATYRRKQGHGAGFFECRLDVDDVYGDYDSASCKGFVTDHSIDDEDLLVATRRIGPNESSTVHVENRRFSAHLSNVENQGVKRVGLVYFVANKGGDGIDVIILPHRAIRSAISDPDGSGIKRTNRLVISRTEGWEGRVEKYGGTVVHIGIQVARGRPRPFRKMVTTAFDEPPF